MVLVLGIVKASLEILGIGIGVQKVVLLRSAIKLFYVYVLFLCICTQLMNCLGVFILEFKVVFYLGSVLLFCISIVV